MPGRRFRLPSRVSGGADDGTHERVEEMVRLGPPGSLRGQVVRCVGYRSADVPPALHRGLPSPWLTLVLTLDEPLHVVAHPDPRQPGGRYDALVGGLHTAPALLAHDGRQSGVQLDVDPLACRALLGLPAGELAGLDLPAEEVLGRRARELRERLREAPGWAPRAAVLQGALQGWLREVPGPPPEVAHAWRRLLQQGGCARVDALAREVGWSERHLSVRFRQETGLSPKQAARVVRFDRARRALQQCPGQRLSDVAAAHGFYDQAHLAREFRDLAGLPPSAWLRAERIGSVQDESP